ncbi:MAG: PEP-CTERM sorting domain-containing protein [Desulfobacterales bacterium]|nr:PEP-CTERM sorting domain-containing protein [Desulfobacterales bacterium]
MLLICLATPAAADILVLDVDPPDTDTNPQWFSPTNPDAEEAWLEGLLGLIYDDPTVEFISKDETGDPLDVVPSSWTYAVLKYGVGAPGALNPNHWAIMDDGDFTLEIGDIAGLPTNGLSHVSYFGPRSVPEPATMLLLGSGLLGLALFGRQRFKK